MTTSDKLKWGLILRIGGGLGFIFACGISLTGIGACLGIPMALVSLSLLIWGVVLLVQARSEKTQQVIAAGVAEGLRAGIAPLIADPRSAPPSAGPQWLAAPAAEAAAEATPVVRCHQCGAEAATGTTVCRECGLPVATAPAHEDSGASPTSDSVT